MFADFTWPWAEVMYWIHFFARSALAVPLPMREGFGPLQAALLGDDGADLGAGSSRARR